MENAYLIYLGSKKEMLQQMNMKKNKAARFLYVLAFLMVTASCDLVEKSYDDYFNSAVEAFNQEDYKKASLEFKNAVKLNPESSQSYYYLALLNEKSRLFKAMKVNLQQALKYDPQLVDARVRLAKIGLLFNDVENASKEVELILSQEEKHPEALIIKAQILSRQKDYQQSMAIVESVLNEDEQLIDALALKAMLLVKQESIDDAVSTINRAISFDKDNPSLYLLRIQIYERIGNNEGLINDYLTLLTIQPKNEQIKYTLASLYLKQNEFKKAEQYVVDLVQAKPGDIKPKVYHLNMLFSDDQKSALEVLPGYVEQSGNKNKLVLAKWALSKQATLDGERILNSMLESAGVEGSDLQDVLFLQAELSLKKKDVEQAKLLIDKILKIKADYPDAKVMKASIILSEGNASEAEEILNNLLWEKPQHEKAMLLLAQLYNQIGENDKAYNKFLEIYKLNPQNKRALYPLVNRAIIKQHYDYASQLTQSALSASPNDLELLTLFARVKILEKKWDEADSVIKFLSKKQNGQLLGELLISQKYEALEEYQKAIDQYKHILSVYPWHSKSLTALADLHERMNKRSEMLGFIERFIKSNPQLVNAILLKSKLIALDGKQKESIMLLESLKEKRPKAPVIYSELANAYYKQGNPNKAIDYLKEGLKIAPNSQSLLLKLGGFYERLGEFAIAQQVYEELIKQYPTLGIAKNNLAMILVNSEKDEDKVRAVELTKAFKKSDDPFLLDSYAWALFHTNKQNEAYSILKKVVLVAPDIPVFRFHLAVALAERGDRTSALLELEQAIELGNKQYFAEIKEAKKMLSDLEKQSLL